MANIALFTAPSNGKELTDKLNEIIDWLNGVTDADRVTDINVAGNTLTVTYINGNTDEFALPDTEYSLANETSNGLVSAINCYKVDALTAIISALNNACAAIEAANDAIDEVNEAYDNMNNGGGGSENAGDGGEGGGGE